MMHLRTWAVLLISAVGVTGSQAQTPLQMGVSVHLAGGGPGVPRQLSLIAQTGATSVRDEVLWAGVELEKGHLAVPSQVDDLVNQTLKAKLQPLLVLDYGNRLYDSGDKPLSPEAVSAFTRYAVFVVQHFKGRVHIYEMWNEWNGMVGNTHRGTARDYVKLIRTVYPAIKAVDPSAVFLGGAIGGLKLDWLSAVLSGGGLGFFDALSIHPYNFDMPARTADTWAHDMSTTETVIHRYTSGRDIPLYITEMGWPTYAGSGGSSPAEAAAYLAQMLLLARTLPFLKGIWWYDFRDDGWNASNKEDNFGLVDPNLKAKPAFQALTAVAQLIGQSSAVDVVSSGNPDLRAVKFHLAANNQVVLALWNASQSGSIKVRVLGSSPLHIRRIADIPDAISAVDSTRATLEVTTSPVLISGTNLVVQTHR
jgi:hypothetical protein